MADPINEIFNGTPEELSPEALEAMRREEQERQAIIEASTQTEETTTGGATASPSQPQQQAKTQPQQEESKSESFDQALNKYSFGILGESEGEKNLAEETISYVGGRMMPFAAASDFAVDLINFVTGGKNLKKMPKFDNSIAQATREITSVMAPTLLTAGAAAPISAAARASKLKILADPLVAKIGTIAWSAGSGAAVDVISETSEDDNLSGTLKQNFPREFGWIPDDIATLSTDSPDVKRGKNVLEGTGLGLFTDVLGSVGDIVSAARRMRGATRYVPESEAAAKYFAGQSEPPTSVIDGIAFSANKRQEALTELGYFSSGSRGFEEPTLGIHDMYGYSESGIRQVDEFGVVSARVDNARILDNIDTVNGRLASVISEPAIKYAVEGSAEYTDVIRMLGNEITAAGDYGYITSAGKTIDASRIRYNSERLVEALGGPRRSFIEEQVSKLNKSDLKGEIRKAFQDLINYDNLEASALVRTSVAGQISDLSEGIRLSSGSGAAGRGTDQILDRLEFLMVADADDVTKRGLFSRLKNTLLNKEGVQDIELTRQTNIDIAKREAKDAVNALREIKENRPEFLEPLMLAYEATNGNVKTMSALNNYLRQSTGILNKAFFDAQPDIPSVVMRGFWANVYNNMLSAFSTPIKAVYAGTAGLIERPLATFAGALMSGDGHTIRRGLHQMNNIMDHTRKAFSYMGETFRRSGVDPDYQGVPARESMLLKDSKQMDVLNSFADAAAANGDFGPQVMMQQVEALNDLAKHPWMRFGNRSMQAFDGFVQAFIGSVEAHGRAFDQVSKGAVTGDTIEAVAQKAYRDMFRPDAMGRDIITDDAVKTAAGEINFNLTNPATEGLNELLKRVPGMKPFLLFTRTPLNSLNFAASHTPFGKFVSEFNDFSRPIEQVPIEKLQSMLASRGIPFDENAPIAYNAIRAELRGRKAIGTLAVMGTVGAFMSGNVTGDGIGDRQKMKFRRDAGWKPRSIKSPTGHWISYDGIPGISDLIALTANIADNVDVLEDRDTQQLLEAASFVLGASVTEKTGLTSIEPLFDILSLKPDAVKRWATGFIPSATIPGSNQLAELTKLMVPNLKVVDDNLATMIANRTPLKAALPDQYDWIDGGKVNEPDNFIARVFNTYSPFKINGKISPEKQFLMDVEYDNRPAMMTDGQGVKLTPDEQSELYRLIAEDQIFKKEVKRIMSSKNGQRFRAEFKTDAGVADINLQDYQNLHVELDNALRQAKRYAIGRMDAENGGSISSRRFQQDAMRQFSRQNNVQGGMEYLEEMQTYSH